jgi:hypothetical protein
LVKYLTKIVRNCEPTVLVVYWPIVQRKSHGVVGIRLFTLAVSLAPTETIRT